MNIDREVLACSAGAGAGVIIPEVLLQYVEPTYGAVIPGTEGIIPMPWGRWSVLVPIASGISALLAGLFWRSNYSSFLTGYGVSSTANGIIRGVFNMPTSRARISMRSRPMIRPRPRVNRASTLNVAKGGRAPTGSYGHRASKSREETETSISSKIVLA